jgi:RimJ/RimL family protein N-acetyltransferase
MRDAFPHPYTLRDAERFIAMATHDRSSLLLAIEVDGEAVGGIGVHPLTDVYRGTAEIGYWLSEDYRGRGIVTDAVRAMIPLSFDLFPIVRLQAGVFESNPASMRVLEKCGFCREAVHRSAITKDGAVMDEHLFVLLK